MSIYLQDLDHASKSIVEQCTTLIQDTLNRLDLRYGDSLSVNGSGKKIKDKFKQIKWSLSEKERLQNLRERLQEGVQRLTLLTSLATK